MTPPMIARYLDVSYNNFHRMWEGKKEDFGIKFLTKICKVTQKKYKEYFI
jgi:DNA-binding Xre family transcriptional regulator